MGKPKRGEWLSEHKEKGQTFKQFLTGMDNLKVVILILR